MLLFSFLGFFVVTITFFVKNYIFLYTFSKMVTILQQISQDSVYKFNCDLCHYKCCRKNDWDRHLLTTKHLNGYNGLQNGLQKTVKGFQCKCGKKYNHRQGLWRHSNNSSSCINKKEGENTIISPFNTINEKEGENTIISPSNTLLTNEHLTYLFLSPIKQNQEFQQKMFEMMKNNIGTTNNTNTNNNNINNINSHNKFNLNIFLNETCKDAMNLSDFIDSIKVKFQDIEYSGENGFVAGVSKIFLQELNKLEICKRPIHCSDVKREIFHIKDQNSWEKERKLLVKVIQQITRKNIVLLVDWRLAHPGCMEYKNIMNNKYDKINGECLGPYKDHEELRDYNRIIANVAKATMIHKKTSF